jgi:hypothetical protein
MSWDDAKEKVLRVEIERRFRERTPPRDIEAVLPESRVGRGEIRGWIKEQVGELPPMTDQEYLYQHALWHRRMIRRVLRELDPETLPQYNEHCRKDPVSYAGRPRRKKESFK